MLRFLQHYIGEDKIDTIMQNFYEEWQFKHPSPDDFISYFNFHLEEDIDWFFKNVFSSTLNIDYSIKESKDKFIVQKLGGFNAPYEVAYYDKNGKELKRSWYKQSSNFAYYDKPINCSYAVIDLIE